MPHDLLLIWRSPDRVCEVKQHSAIRNLARKKQMKFGRRRILIIGAFIAAAVLVASTHQSCLPKEAEPAAMVDYPETRRVDQLDDYHGVKVADPYRWLEADVRESPEVAAWVTKQNEVARAYLDA